MIMPTKPLSSDKKFVGNRTAPNSNLTCQDGNCKGRYLHLVQMYEEMKDPAEEAREEQLEKENQERLEQAERDAQRSDPNAESDIAPGLKNSDIPNKTFLTSPGSGFRPGVDNLFTYKQQPVNPGEYNEYEFVRPDGTEAKSPPVLRDRAIYFQRQERKEAGEPVAVATGEYVETWSDFIIPATLSLNGARYMGLMLPLPAKYISPLGSKQISAFDEIFSNPSPGALRFHQADGKTIAFKRPSNFFTSRNEGAPHLGVIAPWLKQLELRDRKLVKHFRQYEDGIYRLVRITDLNANRIDLHRGDNGLLEGAQTTDGFRLVFSNDELGHRTLVVLIGRDGSRLELARYAYDSKGRMTAADCVFAMSVRYYWHPSRDLLLRWHNTTLRSETHFIYDDEGRVLRTQTNGIWNDDFFRYDPSSYKTSYVPSNDEGLTQTFIYDENYNVTQEVNALGCATLCTFDSAGFETGITDANGNTTTKSYDAFGNVGRRADAEGRITVYAWGPYGELHKVVDGAGNVCRFDYDERANLIAEVDAEGGETRFLCDERGHVLRVIHPDGAQESRSYDENGLLIACEDARGGTTRFVHDAFGRVIETTDPLGAVTRMEYAAGAGGFATPTAVIYPDGVRVSRSFTPDGALASITDGEGRTWTYTYGAFDVLQAIQAPGGGTLSFARDGEGRVTCITNENGLNYQVIRDAAGRTIAEDDFDGRRTTYTRDPAGRIIEILKPDGIRLVYAYDRTDKLASVKSYAARPTEADSPTDETFFWYDRRGLLVKASNKAALIEFERDRNGRIVSEVVNGRAVKSRLNARGHRIRRQIGKGSIDIARDALGLASMIAIDDHAPFNFIRDAVGRETCRESANGFRLEQTWSVSHLLTQTAGSHQAAFANPMASPFTREGVVARRSYAWNHSRTPLTVEDLNWGATRYQYDANNQVANAESDDGFLEGFSYDPAGNIESVSVHGSLVGADVDRLLAWRSTPGGVVQLARGSRGELIALKHDACGRVIERRVEQKGFRPQTWCYGWDAHDRLVRCSNPNGETWYYRYDPFGRRLTKVRKLSESELAWTACKHAALVPEQARQATHIWIWPERPNTVNATDGYSSPVVGSHFQWDGEMMVEEAPLHLDGAINWDASTRWHFEPESFYPIAKQTSDGCLFPIVTDHLGTPREIFDECGHLAWAAAYTTWGVMRSAKLTLQPCNDNDRATYRKLNVRQAAEVVGLPKEAAEFCPIRFQGQWADCESGLYYNMQRYYSPDIAQYISVDPIGLAGGERTSGYVSNPNVFVDPLGLRSPNPSWSTARSNFWKEYAEQLNNPRYSPDNIARMRMGLAPRMTIIVRNRRTGQQKTVDVSVELHHRELTQRQGGAASNEPWNLTPSTPWGHESMDEYRSLGYDPVQILNGTNSWTNKGY